jgi:hypothetical protein
VLIPIEYIGIIIIIIIKFEFMNTHAYHELKRKKEKIESLKCKVNSSITTTEKTKTTARTLFCYN